ncbi:hypothetical protein SKAU_G00181870 [Synaphobranchus kaupii]|uniref:Uncharacterized protein n=1 Tax=Synaphobranchus kaupii TaxID=118154 RepID=A0A9Q1FC86_SYNKA|nr:hypothetical protein SKAU_G00181870 [Synaphobranchus kaupii]
MFLQNVVEVLLTKIWLNSPKTCHKLYLCYSNIGPFFGRFLMNTQIRRHFLTKREIYCGRPCPYCSICNPVQLSTGRY